MTYTKRGAPKGHKGATRQTPEPDEIIDIKADFCEDCNSSDLEIENVESTTIEDIPPPPKIKVTQYKFTPINAENADTYSLQKIISTLILKKDGLVLTC